MISKVIINPFQWFSPSGGILYHLKAHRFRATLWKFFCQNLDAALLKWIQSAPAQEDLLLFGPSGGYTLSSAFLNHFRNITLIDPDPLAPFFFKKAHPLRSYKIQVVRTEITKNLPATLNLIRTMLHAQPKASVLFSNVLGQLFLHLDDPTQKEFILFFQGLDELLKNRHFSSYHDRLSGPGKVKSIAEPWISDRRLKDEELAPVFFDSNTVLQSHFTEEAFKEIYPRLFFTWPIKPGITHLIEGVFCHGPFTH